MRYLTYEIEFLDSHEGNMLAHKKHGETLQQAAERAFGPRAIVVAWSTPKQPTKAAIVGYVESGGGTWAVVTRGRR